MALPEGGRSQHKGGPWWGERGSGSTEGTPLPCGSVFIIPTNPNMHENKGNGCKMSQIIAQYKHCAANCLFTLSCILIGQQWSRDCLPAVRPAEANDKCFAPVQLTGRTMLKV